MNNNNKKKPLSYSRFVTHVCLFSLTQVFKP